MWGDLVKGSIFLLKYNNFIEILKAWEKRNRNTMKNIWNIG